jgi:hypothetical protein
MGTSPSTRQPLTKKMNLPKLWARVLHLGRTSFIGDLASYYPKYRVEHSRKTAMPTLITFYLYFLSRELSLLHDGRSDEYNQF